MFTPPAAWFTGFIPDLPTPFDAADAIDLKAFKSGARGADPKDANGHVMATIAGNMSDEQMKAVADYAMGLR